jgi:hypothetical protein
VDDQILKQLAVEIEKCSEFKRANALFTAAAFMTRGDPVRIDMIKHLRPKIAELEEQQAAMTNVIRSVDASGFSAIRERVYASLEEQTKRMTDLTIEIIAVLGPLDKMPEA